MSQKRLRLGASLRWNLAVNPRKHATKAPVTAELGNLKGWVAEEVSSTVIFHKVPKRCKISMIIALLASMRLQRLPK